VRTDDRRAGEGFQDVSAGPADGALQPRPQRAHGAPDDDPADMNFYNCGESNV